MNRNTRVLRRSRRNWVFAIRMPCRRAFALRKGVLSTPAVRHSSPGACASTRRCFSARQPRLRFRRTRRERTGSAKCGYHPMVTRTFAVVRFSSLVKVPGREPAPRRSRSSGIYRSLTRVRLVTAGGSNRGGKWRHPGRVAPLATILSGAVAAVDREGVPRNER